jgi:3-dehydroquinate dehydratase type I
MLGVAFGPPTMAEALQTLPHLAEQADVIELRLDLIDEPFDLSALLDARGNCPVVVTLRPEGQGGRSVQPESERLKVLQAAADLGADYVDVEWDAAEPEALQRLKASGTAVIVSRHDFATMPPDLDTAWWDTMAAAGADVVKVVGMASDVRDCLPVVRAFRRATLPTVAIAMGVAGLPSRVLALREPACLLTFAAPDSGGGTAPGQITVSEMRNVYHASRLGEATQAYGLMGHSLDTDGARRYNDWFARLDIDAVAVPFEVQDGADATVAAYRELPISGWHVHGAPLQAQVGRALDALAVSAQRQGRVNAVVGDGSGALTGHWVESPAEQLALWTGRSAPDGSDSKR